MSRLPYFVLLVFAPLGSMLSAQESDSWPPHVWADAVIHYDPLYWGGPPPDIQLDPEQALGPNNANGAPENTVSLGHGGLLQLEFLDNILTNSGHIPSDDLIVYEAGGYESTYVALRAANPETVIELASKGYLPNAEGWFELGNIWGGTRHVDIDDYFLDYPPGALHFDAIQIIDDPFQGGSGGPSTGADIDAVAVLSVIPILSLSSNQISATSGEDLILEIDFPGSEAGMPYAVLSAAGRGPTLINGFEIPLDFDRGLIAGLSGWAPPIAYRWFGLLDANGDGQALVKSDARLAPFAGRSVYFAVLSYEKIGVVEVGRMVSFAHEVTILP